MGQARGKKQKSAERKRKREKSTDKREKEIKDQNERETASVAEGRQFSLPT